MQFSIAAFYQDEGNPLEPELKTALESVAHFVVDANSDAEFVKKAARNAAAVLARVHSDNDKTLDMSAEINRILNETKEAWEKK